jgi:hypothetical protein
VGSEDSPAAPIVGVRSVLKAKGAGLQHPVPGKADPDQLRDREPIQHVLVNVAISAGCATATPRSRTNFTASSLTRGRPSVVAWSPSGSKNTLSRCPRNRQQLTASCSTAKADYAV